MFFIHEIWPVCKHIGIEINDCIFSSRQGQDRVNNIDIWMNKIERKEKNKESWSTVVHSIHTIYPFLYVFVFSIKLYGCCVLYFYQPISQLLQLIACVGRAGYTVTITMAITITNTINIITITITIWDFTFTIRIIIKAINTNTITIYETSLRPSASSPTPSDFFSSYETSSASSSSQSDFLSTALLFAFLS